MTASLIFSWSAIKSTFEVFLYVVAGHDLSHIIKKKEGTRGDEFSILVRA